MNTFANKTMIITGAGSGIGKGLAEYFAKQEAILLLLDINGDAVKDVSKSINQNGGKSEFDVLDVSDETKTNLIWAQFAKKYGRLDYVFNNAGYGMAEECQDIPSEQWRKMIDVNLMSVIYGSMAAFKIMKENGGGHIVNTASLAGLIGSPGALPYATTKYAVVGFSKSLRIEGASFNIHVTALCPGFIDTKIYENAWSNSIPQKLFRKTIPLPIISIEEAIPVFVKGIEKKKQLVVLPKYANVLYWTSKIFPLKLEQKQIIGMSKFRKMKKKLLG